MITIGNSYKKIIIATKDVYQFRVFCVAIDCMYHSVSRYLCTRQMTIAAKKCPTRHYLPSSHWPILNTRPSLC